MGDRGNVVIVDSYSPPVYLYTHWEGYQLPDVVATALQRGSDRHNDASYLARIVFCEMVRDDLDGTTGYGISARMMDNEYPLIVLDCIKREVYCIPESRISDLHRGVSASEIATERIPMSEATGEAIRKMRDSTPAAIT